MLSLVSLSVLSLPVASRAQTKPLAGTVGTIGVPARVGKFQFVLTGASFATRVDHTDTAIADKGKKFLVLRYTLQNPGTQELGLDWAQVRFTVVGADNANHENAELVLNPETMSPLNLQLKPAQKVPCVTFVEVPATDPVPKLIVQNESAPVVRYDLKGKIKKFTGLFAAPDGVTALDAGVAKLAQKVDLGYFDFVVEKVEESAAALGEVAPEDGKKLVVVQVAFTNPGKMARSLDWSVYALSMKDANNEPVDFLQTLLRAVGNTVLTAEVNPGETVRGRLIFSAAKEARPDSLAFAYGEGRSAVVSLKAPPPAAGK